jgi:hypothetical protein
VFVFGGRNSFDLTGYVMYGCTKAVAAAVAVAVVSTTTRVRTTTRHQARNKNSLPRRIILGFARLLLLLPIDTGIGTLTTVDEQYQQRGYYLLLLLLWSPEFLRRIYHAVRFVAFVV